MRAIPEVMPLILLHWLTTPEADAGSMAIDFEYSHQYPLRFCCDETDGVREDVTKVWN